jgi:capsular polysaccharide transport system permease protein
MEQTQTATRAVPIRTGRTITALMLREMSSTYGRSAAGYFWAVAEPVGGVVLLTIVFSLALRSPSLGDNFALFYASGMLPFSLYNELANKIGRSISFSKQLLFYPGVTFMDAILARVLLNTLTQAMILVIILGGIIWIYDINVILDVPAITVAIGMAVLLAMGVGTLNCYLFWRLPAWDRIWVILNRPMFIMSCIFFPFESIPAPFQDYLWFNPVVHIVGQMRHGIYATYDPDYVSLTYCFGFGLACLFLGFMFLGRYHREIVNE